MNSKIQLHYDYAIQIAVLTERAESSDAVVDKEVRCEGTIDIPAVTLAVSDDTLEDSIGTALQEAIDVGLTARVRQGVRDAEANIETQSKLLPETAKLAEDLQLIRQNYTAHVSQLVDQFDPLPEDEFWPLIDLLVAKLGQSKAPAHYIERAVDGVLWELVNGAKSGALTGWIKACGFFHRYQLVRNLLYGHCDKMIGCEKSDDSYGDFIDALPLAGRSTVHWVLTSSPSYSALDGHLLGHAPLGMRDVIMNGEHYVVTTIERKLHEYFGMVAREARRPRDEDDGGE